MTHGTSYFVSLEAAYRYYAEYRLYPPDVRTKVEAGEIHIGKPTLLSGEKLIIIDNSQRYAITRES